jgi:Lrp/AsnC family leucine-responsive transcriptional regulator
MDVFRQRSGKPEVVECVALTGEMDYFLRVVVAGHGALHTFVMDNHKHWRV